jgi:two-component SAPR family response regulator
MDRMNGIEAACRMRQITPDAKIVFISCHYTTDDAAGMVGLLAGAFVPKAEANLIPTIKCLLTVQ